jgi:Caspase domain
MQQAHERSGRTRRDGLALLVGMPMRLVVPALAVWLVASVAPAHADTERYAVVIGDNRGASDEQPLRFAESDAQRFADLLADIGGVPGENQVVLRGNSADQVRRALIATNERIRTAPRSAADAVLLVYYSGHGDADALHLGDTALPLRELEALVRGSPAAVRILVIDSCRSGSITRVKGGRPAPPLALATTAPLLDEGMIVLTASTLSEDAQESDPLGGSFFTHYLLSGLRGAADDNADRVVTVAEAFGYARDQTIIASSRTLAGTQHPTFHYDLRGRADLPLADLGNSPGHGTLTLPTGASWLVVRIGSSPGVVGEIATDARRRTLSLPPGSYAVRGRARDALLEGTATVAAGRDTAVDPDRLDRTMYASLVRKGKGETLAGVSGPFAGYTAQTVLLDDQRSAVHGPVVGWTWVRPSITLSPRISAILFGLPKILTADLRATRTWDLGRLSIDLGFTIGGGITAFRGIVDGRLWPIGVVLHADATVGVSMPLWGRTYLGAELAAQIYSNFDGQGGLNPPAATANLLWGTWL